MGRQFSTLRCIDGADEPTSRGTCPSCLTQACLGFKSTDSYKPNGTAEAVSTNSKRTTIKSKPPSSSVSRVSNGSISFDRLSQQQQQQQLVRTRSSKKRKTAQSSLSSCCCRTTAPSEQQHEVELNKNDNLRRQTESPPSAFLINPRTVPVTTSTTATKRSSSSGSSETNSQTNLVQQPLPSSIQHDDGVISSAVVGESPPLSSRQQQQRQRTSSSPPPPPPSSVGEEQLVKQVEGCLLHELNVEHPNQVTSDAAAGGRRTPDQQAADGAAEKDDEVVVETTDVKESSSSKLICRFRNLVKDETIVLRKLIEKWQAELEISEGKDDCPTEACDDIRAVIGKTGLIIDQRFKQFLGLVDQADGKPSSKKTDRPVFESDLDGFWEMDYIQVKNVKDTFSLLEERKKNGWEKTSSPKPLPSATQTKKKRRTPKKNQAPTPSLTPEALARRKAIDQERKKRLREMREMKLKMKNSQSDFVSFAAPPQEVATKQVTMPTIVDNDDEVVVEKKPVEDNDVIGGGGDNCKAVMADKHIYNHLNGDGDATINGLHTTLVG